MFTRNGSQRSSAAQNFIARLVHITSDILEHGEGLKAVRAQCLVESIQGEFLEIVGQQWLKSETCLADLTQKHDALNELHHDLKAEQKVQVKQAMTLRGELAALRRKLEEDAELRYVTCYGGNVQKHVPGSELKR